MTRTSLKSYIILYLKEQYPRAVLGAVIEQLAGGYGFSASNGSRRARELAEKGTIEAIYSKGVRGERLVSYRYILEPPEKAKREVARVQNRIKLEKVLVDGEWVMREVILPNV